MIVKITGALVEPPLTVLHIHEGFAVSKHGKKVTHLDTLKAIHGMLESTLPWCRKFRGHPEQIGFIFNAHDACAAKRSVNRKAHTVRFHMDDLMSSHPDKKVKNEFLK